MGTESGDAFGGERGIRPGSAEGETGAGRERLGRAGLDYRGLIEQSLAVAYVGRADEVGSIYISPQVEAMLGYGPEDLSGENGFDHIHGGRGGDVIHVNDGQRDFVDRGPGRDEVYFDNRPGELVDCEIGNPPPNS